MPADVAAAFSAFPAGVRARLLEVRDLIFETAAAIEGVGPLTETLKWGEPAYLTQATGSGSTIRLGWFRSSERACAVLFNCRTTLVDDFRSQFPDVFAYEKNRAILLDARNRCHRRRFVPVSEWRSLIIAGANDSSFCPTLLMRRR